MKSGITLTVALAVSLLTPVVVLADEAPAVDFRAGSLLDVVPEDGVSIWHKSSNDQTALIDAHAEQVLDAMLDARFGQLAFDTLQQVGLDEAVLAELKSYRNIATTVGGLVPWRELLRHEFVYAESMSPALGQAGVPSLMFACRLAPADREHIERSLAAMFGALTIGSPIHLRYDIDTREELDGGTTTSYAVRLENLAVLQMALHDDVLVFGFGEEFFTRSLALVCGGEGPRLTASQRYRKATVGLPRQAPCRRFVDVRAMLDGMRDVQGLLAGREFAAGVLPGLLSDGMQLLSHVDTVATTAQPQGQRMLVETLTCFDAELATGHPMYKASFAAPLSSDLLSFIPADAVSFSTRGSVDLAPLYRSGLRQIEQDWAAAAELMWGARVLGAAADFSIEHDLLSWIGSEHVSVDVPTRGRFAPAGTTDSVILWQLDDPQGTRKCLERMENVFNVAIPGLLGSMQAWLRKEDSKFVPDVQLTAGGELYPMLKRLEVTGLPIATRPISYGIMGRMLVCTTSEDALEYCLAVAAGEEDGLEQHPLAAGLVEREGLSSADLGNYGSTVQELVALTRQAPAWIGATLGSATAGTEGEWAVDNLNDCLEGLATVLEAFDFLGNGVTYGESRDEGRAHYERTVVELAPRPARKPTAPVVAAPIH